MGNQISFSQLHLLPVARAEIAEVEVQESFEPAASSPVESHVEPHVEPEAPASPPVEAPPVSPPVTLERLTAEEVEELKAEIVNDVVNKLAGQDGEKLDGLIEPELITAPYDPRFPNRNQARHCFVRFNEYHKCVYERGEDHARCQFYQKSYQSMCPADWLENWNELREKGLWTGKY